MQEVKNERGKIRKKKGQWVSRKTTAKRSKNIREHKNNQPTFPEKRKRNEEINKPTTSKSTKRG
jgi:hypothetical protein